MVPRWFYFRQSPICAEWVEARPSLCHRRIWVYHLLASDWSDWSRWVFLSVCKYFPRPGSFKLLGLSWGDHGLTGRACFGVSCNWILDLNFIVNFDFILVMVLNVIINFCFLFSGLVCFKNEPSIKNDYDEIIGVSSWWLRFCKLIRSVKIAIWCTW